MVTPERTLDHAQARSFYDRLGARQDSQGFYEDRATRHVTLHGDFPRARRVLEFGCGTGRFAETLLDAHLPPDARYEGLDLSGTMVGLARERLARFGDRARVEQTDGSPAIARPDASFDRFVSNYVLDLLSEADIERVVSEAWRLLEPGGRLCLVSLTQGVTPLSRLVMAGWRRLQALSPKLVGGCRPVRLPDFVREPAWKIEYHEVVVAFGIPSEVLIASRSVSGPIGA